MQARKMLFASILSICALSLKLISVYNEEMIVVLYIIGFIIFIRKSLGNTFKVTLDNSGYSRRITTILQFYQSNSSEIQ